MRRQSISVDQKYAPEEAQKKKQIQTEAVSKKMKLRAGKEREWKREKEKHQPHNTTNEVGGWRGNENRYFNGIKINIGYNIAISNGEREREEQKKEEKLPMKRKYESFRNFGEMDEMLLTRAVALLLW